jgi:hypothetical protein
MGRRRKTALDAEHVIDRIRDRGLRNLADDLDGLIARLNQLAQLARALSARTCPLKAPAVLQFQIEQLLPSVVLLVEASNWSLCGHVGHEEFLEELHDEMRAYQQVEGELADEDAEELEKSGEGL